MATKKTYDNKEIRAYLRANPHYTDGMVADHFGVSTGVISANKAHITMGTDTDNPQARAKAVFASKGYKKQLIVIKTNEYHLLIDEDGQYSRCELKTKKIAKLSDEQAKAVMLNRLHETYNI
ncbi:hypothetical protein [Flavobacterium sp.]|uniref:hypothetical protein n=1 Tax=Flavobacterium sp. TaxID=239 RepID=UPI0026160461|nr:hypothetical protein [Flavobacterium sp.]